MNARKSKEDAEPKYRFRLGEEVTFTHVFKQVAEYYDSVDRLVRTWTPTPLKDDHFGKQSGGRGFITGVRTMSNGYTTYRHEDGPLYHNIGHVTAYLVAYSLHRRPLFVPLDAVSGVYTVGDATYVGVKDLEQHG